MKQQIPFLVDTSHLLLEHISCIFLISFQLCRCVCFMDWLPVKSESDLHHRQTLSFTIGFHQFTKQHMPLNPKLHYRTILACQLQINTIVVLGLDSFLGSSLAMVSPGIFLAAASQKRDQVSTEQAQSSPRSSRKRVAVVKHFLK